MDGAIATAAAAIATAFTLDLARDYRRRPRPHVAAYTAGMAFFAIATWALAFGLLSGWTGFSYRLFFLFGAILNIPFLALGSMYLVVGRRAGTITFLIVGAIAAISTTLTTTVGFASPLPAGGIPHDIFPPISEGFGPRLLAAIAGGLASTIIIVLSAVSAYRFWRKDRKIFYGNILITLGTFAAAWGGTGLALGEAAAFALSLLLAATLIWSGYRVASGRRQIPASTA
ncbi:MAG TPA: hypothetical protein VJR05_09985 [Acidimicrobiia bacterium]|nr:hypothetical protein [Acidimicrobiia bacterium]